ncbi:Cupin domain protein [compost metagenome]|uniref:cupin domain-containing protein n=1 Tax=Achromobacter sp. Root83 TaxID=1736602 RepID=UPI00070CACF1|nr:cupin domain-containing protein [Achromobacter sp. Root83]KRC84777.1 cupin [Achromobacter sp. Root83]
MSKIMKFGLPFIAAGALLGQIAHGASHHDAAAAKPADPIVTELMTKNLPDIPGKDALMLIVDYPPGAADPIHRHDAYGFVYVLEGSIIMQVKGGKEVTLTPGQTFYEGPDDIHTVGRNASQTKPAKFLVVLIKKQGAPALVPVK